MIKEVILGGIDKRLNSGFSGRIQQVLINNKQILEYTHQQELNYEGNIRFQYVEDLIHNSVSFLSHHTYLGMPQIKVYNEIDIFFKFKTAEENGLLLFNAGKKNDFIAVELVKGHVQYTVNMGYGNLMLKDNSQRSLSDNKFHSVRIFRPNRNSQVMIIDNYNKVSSEGLGESYFLNLDGMMYLGGVKAEMYEDLPSAVISKIGFQGCLSNIEINNEGIDPNKVKISVNIIKKLS